MLSGTPIVGCGNHRLFAASQMSTGTEWGAACEVPVGDEQSVEAACMPNASWHRPIDVSTAADMCSPMFMRRSGEDEVNKGPESLMFASLATFSLPVNVLSDVASTAFMNSYRADVDSPDSRLFPSSHQHKGTAPNKTAMPPTVGRLPSRFLAESAEIACPPWMQE